MCCECKNLVNAIMIALNIILIIIAIFVIINNQNEERNPNILVAIAKPRR